MNIKTEIETLKFQVQQLELMREQDSTLNDQVTEALRKAHNEQMLADQLMDFIVLHHSHECPDGCREYEDAYVAVKDAYAKARA